MSCGAEKWTILRDQMYLKIRNLLWNISAGICRLVPVSPKYIWFESEIDFVENTRALYEYMIRQPKYQDYRLVWLVQDPEAYPKRKNTIFLERGKEDFRFHYYLNRCRFILFTHPYWLKKWKKSQTVINTWHGNPFKAPSGKLQACFDTMIASSQKMAVYRRREFSGEFGIDILGAPRLDWLYGRNDYLDSFTGGRKFKKVIYSMPTFKQTKHWQDSREKPTYSINVVTQEKELLALNEALAQRDVLMVCIIHHLQNMDGIYREKLSNILYLRDEDYGAKGIVMNQMLCSADALLTDFSGVFLDYILLDRPIGFYRNTWNEYTRGFAMEDPEEYMPGPYLYTLEDLMAFISDVAEDRDAYCDKRKQVRDKVHEYQGKENCRRFLEYFHI